jgi:hypothetical protein
MDAIDAVKMMRAVFLPSHRRGHMPHPSAMPLDRFVALSAGAEPGANHFARRRAHAPDDGKS